MTLREFVKQISPYFKHEKEEFLKQGKTRLLLPNCLPGRQGGHLVRLSVKPPPSA